MHLFIPVIQQWHLLDAKGIPEIEGNCSVGKKSNAVLLAMQETWVQSLGWEDPLEKKATTHSNILTWKIPLTV